MRTVTTLLEVAGGFLAIAAGYVMFGVGAALALSAAACFGLSWALTRGGAA